MSIVDNIVNEFDIALKTLSNKKYGTDRPYPPEPAEKNSEELTQQEKKLSIQMMRVNLAGEVAAQALYRGQALVCKDPEIKKHLIEAGEEETDHLVWCKKRLDELDGKGSILNPIWYAGSFAIGAVFGNFGEKVSLGFVEETEKQVVAHIDKHLDKISPKDEHDRIVFAHQKNIFGQTVYKFYGIFTADHVKTDSVRHYFKRINTTIDLTKYF